MPKLIPLYFTCRSNDAVLEFTNCTPELHDWPPPSTPHDDAYTIFTVLHYCERMNFILAIRQGSSQLWY